MKRELDTNGTFWMYLRKSRADLEAELRGEGETLTKHRNALYRLAKQYNISITQVYPEIVSGESIFHRPEMVRMLKDMEDNQPTGILCMDIDRLGRGDKIDQGIIERTFKDNKTLIITPTDIFDMNEESGEFNVEVRSFLARLDLKQTTKRLQGGRVRSVEEGNYIGTRPPYGFLIHKESGSRFLIPHPVQAPIVQMIYTWYVYGKLNDKNEVEDMGSRKIANELNKLGYLSYEGIDWSASAVLNIIKNKHNIGFIQWKKKVTKKSKEVGKVREVKTRDKAEWIDVNGKHVGIVSDELYYMALDILAGRYHIPFQLVNGITNPLAGLIVCELCGGSMLLRPNDKQLPHIICKTGCTNRSARFEYVEKSLLQALKETLANYKASYNPRKIKEESKNSETLKAGVKTLQKELSELESQKLTLHDYLERKIYTEDVYLERSLNLAERIKEKKDAIEYAEKEIINDKKKETAVNSTIPNFENVLKFYPKAKTAAEKNKLLKSILHHATYLKLQTQKNDDFILTLHPKVPK